MLNTSRLGAGRRVVVVELAGGSARRRRVAAKNGRGEREREREDRGWQGVASAHSDNTSQPASPAPACQPASQSVGLQPPRREVEVESAPLPLAPPLPLVTSSRDVSPASPAAVYCTDIVRRLLDELAPSWTARTYRTSAGSAHRTLLEACDSTGPGRDHNILTDTSPPQTTSGPQHQPCGIHQPRPAQPAVPGNNNEDTVTSGHTTSSGGRREKERVGEERDREEEKLQAVHVQIMSRIPMMRLMNALFRAASENAARRLLVGDKGLLWFS